LPIATRARSARHHGWEQDVHGLRRRRCGTRPGLPRYLEWQASQRFPLEDLVTRRYRLDEVNEALDDLAGGRILGRAIFEMGKD